MPEILTESFCERCGTRYTFESAAPRAARLTGIKVLSRGLKNFVMSDDTSMDEAMAAARSETDREVTSQQLDAFHKTFNFCMTCRQYTCGNCWNDAEGRCLTCAPHLGHEIMPAPFPDLPSNGIATADTNGLNGHAPEAAALSASSEALAWPTMDLDRESDDGLAAIDEGEPIEPIDAVARLAFLGATDAALDEAREDELAHGAAAADAGVEEIDAVEIEPVEAGDAVEAAAIAEVVDEPEVVAAPEAIDAPEVAAAEPAAEAEPDLRAAAAASATNELMQRFRPGQSLDDEIAAYEREQAAQDAAAAAAGALAVGAIADAPDEDPRPRRRPMTSPQPQPRPQRSPRRRHPTTTSPSRPRPWRPRPPSPMSRPSPRPATTSSSSRPGASSPPMAWMPSCRHPSHRSTPRRRPPPPAPSRSGPPSPSGRAIDRPAACPT